MLGKYCLIPFHILCHRRWAKSTLVLVPLFGVHYVGFLVLSYLGVGERLELVWLFIDQLFTSFQVMFTYYNNRFQGVLKLILYFATVFYKVLSFLRISDGNSNMYNLIIFKTFYMPPFLWSVRLA